MAGTTIDALLIELEEFGRREGGMWNVGPEGGALLAWFVRQLDAQHVLEVGTSNGYSAIWLARALRETGGALVTLEVEPRKIAMARENLEKADLDALVTIVEGPAVESLKALGGTFALVFIDADKPQYPDYLREVARLTGPGSVIVADNIATHAEETAAYRAVADELGLDSVAIPVAGGFLVSRVT